jgi:hypothetical protein
MPRATGSPRARAVGLAIASLAVLVAPSARAQDAAPPPAAQRRERGIPHEGIYASFGVGAGTARVDCSRCGERPIMQRDPWQGGFAPLTFAFGVGWSVRPNLLLGAEVDAWVQSRYSMHPQQPGRSEDGTQLSLSFTGAVAQYYPLAEVGLYVKGGVGVGRVYMDDGPEKIRATGLAALGGVGYDIRLGRSMALTPYVHAVHLRVGSRGGQIRDVAVQSPANPRVVHAGVAFHYY